MTDTGNAPAGELVRVRIEVRGKTPARWDRSRGVDRLVVVCSECGDVFETDQYWDEADRARRAHVAGHPQEDHVVEVLSPGRESSTDFRYPMVPEVVRGWDGSVFHRAGVPMGLTAAGERLVMLGDINFPHAEVRPEAGYYAHRGAWEVRTLNSVGTGTTFYGGGYLLPYSVDPGREGRDVQGRTPKRDNEAVYVLAEGYAGVGRR